MVSRGLAGGFSPPFFYVQDVLYAAGAGMRRSGVLSYPQSMEWSRAERDVPSYPQFLVRGTLTNIIAHSMPTGVEYAPKFEKIIEVQKGNDQ